MTGTRLSRGELYQLVWSEPVSKLAPRYGVSDVGFAKACRGANIPLPPRGYWAKVRAGAKVRRTPLPPAGKDAPEIVVIGNNAGSSRSGRTRDSEEALVAASDPVPVPEQLCRTHPFVTATRQKAVGARPSDDGRLYLRGDSDAFTLRVARPSLRRCLLILQAICLEAERRGWSIEAGRSDGYQRTAGARVRIGRHRYPVEIEERTEVVPFTEDELRRWRAARSSWDTRGSPPPRRRPTGKLALVLPGSWGGYRARWADGKRQQVESLLADFFATLEVRARDDEARHERAERERVIQEEQQRQARIQRARAEWLDREVAAWQEAERIREYVARLRARISTSPKDERERLAAWCDWASERADQLDPTTNAQGAVGLDDVQDEGWFPSEFYGG